MLAKILEFYLPILGIHIQEENNLETNEYVILHPLTVYLHKD